MKVKFLRGTFAPGGVQRLPGDVADLPDSTAKDLIRMRKAEAAAAEAELTPDRTGKGAPKPAKPAKPKE